MRRPWASHSYDENLLGRGDRCGVPAAFEFAEVLRVHTRDTVRDLLERLASFLALASDGFAERAGDRVSDSAARHRRGEAERTRRVKCRNHTWPTELDMFPLRDSGSWRSPSGSSSPPDLVARASVSSSGAGDELAWKLSTSVATTMTSAS